MIEQLRKMDKSRKTWRLVNGVLFEKTVGDVIPELEQMISNLETVIKQLNEALTLKKPEAANLEKAYDSIMKQASLRKAEAQEDREVKSSGLLV